MSECDNCGKRIAAGVDHCPDCGVQTQDQGATGASVDGGRRLVTDGGTDSGGVELGAAVISLGCVFYFLLNLLMALGSIGVSAGANALGEGGAAASSGIFAVVFVILTVGFIVAPAGVMMAKSWGWTVMAGVWGLNLLWGVAQAALNGIDALGIIFALISLAVLAWIYVRKGEQLPIGGAQPARPA